MAVLEDLEPAKPTRVKLLGREFVLWRDGEGEWRAFENLCPHRLAPLSEGRIEASDGSLQCSYHGWRFDGTGACVKVPQAVSEEQERRACGHRKAQAKAFPVQVKADLVWLWPEDSSAAFINSAMVEPQYGEYEEDEYFQMHTPYMRDIPYAVDVLLENVIDLSHVAFAHHGVQGNRNHAGWYKVTQLRTSDSPGALFKVKLDSMANVKELEVMAKLLFNGGKVTQVMEFIPPGMAKYTFTTDRSTKPNALVVAISTPVGAEESRIFWRLLVRKSTTPKLTSFLLSLGRPKWINHMENSAVLDGDMVLLSDQMKTMRYLESQGKSWNSGYFCPTEADVPVTLFRNWFHGQKGKGGPKLPNGQLLLSGKGNPKGRMELLDRYHSHTQHCKACSGALRNIQTLEKAAQGAGCMFGVLWLAAMKNLVRTGGPYGQAGAVVGLAASLLAAKILNELKQRFIYVDYQHWKR